MFSVYPIVTKEKITAVCVAAEELANEDVLHKVTIWQKMSLRGGDNEHGDDQQDVWDGKMKNLQIQSKKKALDRINGMYRIKKKKSHLRQEWTA